MSNPVIQQLHDGFDTSTSDFHNGHGDTAVIQPGEVVEILVGIEWIACPPVKFTEWWDGDGTAHRLLMCPIKENPDGSCYVRAADYSWCMVKAELVNGFRVRPPVP